MNPTDAFLKRLHKRIREAKGFPQMSRSKIIFHIKEIHSQVKDRVRGTLERNRHELEDQTDHPIP